MQSRNGSERQLDIVAIRSQNRFALVRSSETSVKGISSLAITKNRTNRDTFVDKTFLLSMEKMYRERANNYIPDAVT